MPRKVRKRKSSELEQGKRARALASIQAELIRPLTLKGLNRWVAEAVTDRTRFLTDTVFGTIRWQKSIGRPLGATLASGFRVEHGYLEMNWAIKSDGTTQDLSKWIHAPEPSVWDMPDSEDHHQVGYMFWAQRPWINSVVVGFADKQPWDSPLHLRMMATYRRIVPDRQDFWMSEARFAVLDETKIVEAPLRVFR